MTDYITPLKPLEEIVQYSQRDPRWKKDKLGFSDNTIEKYGCLITASAMVLTYHGITVTPGQLNKIMQGYNGFVGALFYYGALSHAYPVETSFIGCKDTPAPMEKVNEWLDKGWPVIVELDYSPSNGFQNHWVTIFRRAGENYWISDPWAEDPSAELVTLTSRYGFAGSPSEIITGVLFVTPPRKTQTVSSPEQKPSPITEGSIQKGQKVRVLQHGLRLRNGPSTTASCLTLVSAGVELVSAGDPVKDGSITWQPVVLYVAANLGEERYIEALS